MKALIEAIKAQLQGDANLSYVANADIFIVPDEDIIPISASFPAIGIKDGPVTRDMDTHDTWNVLQVVSIIIYQELTTGESPIIGQADPKIYGVLEIAAAVYTSLDENNLSISGMYDARCISETESETIGFEELVLQRKKLIFEYSKTEDRS